MMNPDKLQEILTEHTKWLRCEGGSRADLRGADLRGADLRGADLRGADLSGADLCGADLRGAPLRGAALRGAALRRADLRDADLSGADLSGADLRGADLRGAALSGANLRRANLRGADLRGADLRGADLSGGEFLAQASVRFTAHGECGRELLAIKTDAKEEPVTLWCGCFTGTPGELREYIAKGDEKHRKSRTFALDTVLTLLDFQP